VSGMYRQTGSQNQSGKDFRIFRSYLFIYYFSLLSMQTEAVQYCTKV
jgi:hypothetical protein